MARGDVKELGSWRGRSSSLEVKASTCERGVEGRQELGTPMLQGALVIFAEEVVDEGILVLERRSHFL